MSVQTPKGWVSLLHDGKAGLIGAVVFFNEYLSLANSAAGGNLSAELPLWIGRTSLRCVLAVMVALFFVQWLSKRPRQLSGPRATPMLVFGWLSWMCWERPAVQALGLEGLSLATAVLVLVAGLTQLAIALRRWGAWFDQTLPSLVISATMFTGAIGMVSSEVGKLANCAPAGNWRGLSIASTVVVLNFLWRLGTHKHSTLKSFGMVVGILGGVVAYQVWLFMAPDPGLCRTLGTIAADPSALIQQPPWAHLMTWVRDPQLMLLLTAGGLGLGVICMADTFSALTLMDQDQPPPVGTPALDLNRELTANALGNVCCGLMGLPPVATSLSRSKLQSQCDKGRWAAAFHGLFLLAIVLFGLQLVANIPRAVLAGCVVLVALDMLNDPMRTLLRWSLRERHASPTLGRAMLMMLLVAGIGLGMHNSAVGMLAGLLMSWVGLLIVRPRARARAHTRGEAWVFTLSGHWSFFNHRAQLDALGRWFREQRKTSQPSALVLVLHDLHSIDFQSARQLQKALEEWTQDGLPLGLECQGHVPDDLVRVLWHQAWPQHG